VNVTAGQPVDSIPGAEKKFYGASLDAENLGERWSANLFAIRQVVGSREDRTGVGGELRYFDPQRNVYSLFDYDPTFKVVNVGMVQGSWQLSPATALNFIADYRLREGHTGANVIAEIRQSLGKSIPAAILTGDTAPERLREASAGGFVLLHKPIQPCRLRAALTNWREDMVAIK
jgi:CheY-like chemotaxis protein